jgi:hypothetical protein
MGNARVDLENEVAKKISQARVVIGGKIAELDTRIPEFAGQAVDYSRTQKFIFDLHNKKTWEISLGEAWSDLIVSQCASRTRSGPLAARTDLRKGV